MLWVLMHCNVDNGVHNINVDNVNDDINVAGSGSGREYMKKIICDKCSTVVEIRSSTVVEIDHVCTVVEIGPLDLRSLR